MCCRVPLFITLHIFFKRATAGEKVGSPAMVVENNGALKATGRIARS